MDVVPYDLPCETWLEVMGRLMLAWDGQWFLKTMEEFGLEAAMRLNTRVRLSFGRIEMRSVLAVLGKPRADDLADALRIVFTYSRVFLSNRMEGGYRVLPEGVEITVSFCPVFENARRANLERCDQACVGCPDLWRTWLAVLLPEEEIEVAALARMGMGDPSCRYLVTERRGGA